MYHAKHAAPILAVLATLLAILFGGCVYDWRCTQDALGGDVCVLTPLDWAVTGHGLDITVSP